MIDAIEETVLGIGRNCHLRCVGHILNLIVKAIFVWRGDFNSDISGASDAEAYAIRRWFRALGKIRNSVKYIMRSDQRRQPFIALQQS